jgi:hypothetical protein
MVAVLDESVSDEPYVLEGRFIDLYDPQLPVFTRKEILPGTQGYFFNLDKAGRAPKILAMAGRAYDSVRKGRTFSFLVKGQVETINSTRVLLPTKPTSVSVNGRETIDPARWDEVGNTYFLTFDNDPEGVRIEIRW